MVDMIVFWRNVACGNNEESLCLPLRVIEVHQSARIGVEHPPRSERVDRGGPRRRLSELTISRCRLEYRNPNSWVHIQARDNFGRIQWASAEWASPVRFNQQGITKDALKPDDRVIITGSPSRNPADTACI